MRSTESKEREAMEFGAGTLFMARMCHSCKVCPFKRRAVDSASSDSRELREPWCPGWSAHKRVYGSVPGTQ